METNLLEYRILSLLRNKDMFIKYSNIIKEPLFNSTETKVLYKLMQYYHKHTKAEGTVPISSLLALLHTRLPEGKANEYKGIVKKIKQFPFSDEIIADEIVKKFAKKQLMKLAILQATHEIDQDNPNIDKVRHMIDDALMVESVEAIDTAYDYFSDAGARLEEDKNEPRIATYLKKVDQSIRGGLAGGELAIAVGPSGVGKTMFLINIAYAAMRQGKKVIYVTLEIHTKRLANRFDQRVTNSNLDRVLEYPNLVNAANEKLRERGAGLLIKDCTSSKLSPNELGMYLERIKKEFAFDMVIVDQVDLMHSPKEFKERRYELSSIVISLRRLASIYNIPIWTASQATRSAGSSGNTTMWDIAEDIGKVNWADAILTISQAQEDKDEGIAYLHVAKNRISEGNPREVLQMDYSRMKITGAKKES